MIEVTLAIGILAVGATAVLALFPLGMDRNRGSIGENYCAEAASDITAYVKTMATADWSDFKASIPSTKTDISAEGATINFDNWTRVDQYAVSDDIWNISGSGDGVFGLKKETDGVVDFAGEAVIWKSNIGSLSEDISVGVFLEINWPVSAKYSLRKKNYYYFEIYNYNYQD